MRINIDSIIHEPVYALVIGAIFLALWISGWYFIASWFTLVAGLAMVGWGGFNLYQRHMEKKNASE